MAWEPSKSLPIRMWTIHKHKCVQTRRTLRCGSQNYTIGRAITLADRCVLRVREPTGSTHKHLGQWVVVPNNPQTPKQAIVRPQIWLVTGYTSQGPRIPIFCYNCAKRSLRVGKNQTNVVVKRPKCQVIFIIFKFRLAIAWHAKTFLKPSGAADRHIRSNLCLRSINM